MTVVVVKLLSHVSFFVTSWTVACQVPLPPQFPQVCSGSCPLSQWCYPAASSSVAPFSFSHHQDLFQWVSFSHQVARAWLIASLSYSNPFARTKLCSMKGACLTTDGQTTVVQSMQKNSYCLRVWISRETACQQAAHCSCSFPFP